MPITLYKFFPRNYFSEASVDVVSCYTTEVKDGFEEIQPSTSLDHSGGSERDSKILALLDTVPSRMGWRQALSLPEEIASLTFTDEYLMLGLKPHNRPLFVCGHIRKQKVNHILIDGGSAVNIMPKSTMRKLGITDDELSQSCLMIQGRPWMHENEVVESTLRQCFKYYKNGERRVSAEVKPFSEAESHFADAKFHIDQEEPVEVMPLEIASIGKQAPKKQQTKEDPPSKEVLSEKEGKTPFEKCEVRVAPKKVESKLSSLDESMTFPVRRVSNQKISNPPSASLENISEMPSTRKEGFDPVA
uniref:Uncharacterized protein n=1 Tax=Chenopodium quinoa TaxID=63459 RepID=A0A803LLV7_CHEQI